MLLKFVDLIFPGGTMNIINIPEALFGNVGDVGMAKDSRCSTYIFAKTGGTIEPMAEPCNC